VRWLTVVCVLSFVLVMGDFGPSLAGDYLVGLFGVPDGDWSVLREAGLDTVLVREDEVAGVRGVPVKKIYVLGVNPGKVKEGLNERELQRRLQAFRGLNDAYGYYLAGDMSCRYKNLVDSLKKRLNIDERVMLCTVKGKEIGCFPDYDVLFYYYPLMRRQASLADMLKDQVATLKQSGFDDYLFVQAHQQFWYKDLIKSAHAHQDSYLYPDGQAVRMLIYYAIATGCKGYFLYDSEAMSGETSRERVLGAAQAIFETHALYPVLARAQSAEFFQRGNGVYGTRVLTPSYDLVFVFYGDAKTNYHPSTQPLKVALRELIDTGKYLSVYRYSPVGCVPASDKLDVPQDHALILIGMKNKENLDTLKLDSSRMKAYAHLLEARAEKLAANLKTRGAFAASGLKQTPAGLEEKIQALLAYIDQMNELKRDAWWRNAGKMPLDGEILNAAQWGRGMAQQTKPGKDDLFNFYYH
jgi:hypothetical protein